MTRVAGEKTPNYMLSAVALDQIRAHNPCVKIIVLLRDPVTRIFAWYNHVKQTEFPWADRIVGASDFDEFISTELADPDGSLTSGEYAAQIAAVRERFPPSHVWLEISKRPRDWGSMLRFLGVAESTEGWDAETKAHELAPQPDVCGMRKP